MLFAFNSFSGLADDLAAACGCSECASDQKMVSHADDAEDDDFYDDDDDEDEDHDDADKNGNDAPDDDNDCCHHHHHDCEVRRYPFGSTNLWSKP